MLFALYASAGLELLAAGAQIEAFIGIDKFTDRMFNELYWKVDEVATPVLWAVAADYFVPVADPIMAWIKYHHLPWYACRMEVTCN